MHTTNFQSPPFGASHCNLRQISAPTNRMTSFSPLHSGQATAIPRLAHVFGVLIVLSVPSIRGKPLQFGRHDSLDLQEQIFQSPPFGASHCNTSVYTVERGKSHLSVPSIRGKPLQSDIHILIKWL